MTILHATPTQNIEHYLTISQTAEYLHRHPNTIRKLIRLGRIEAVRLNGQGRPLVSVASIEKALTRMVGNN